MECTGAEDPSAEGQVPDTSLRQRGKKRPAPNLDCMKLARDVVPKVANSELAGLNARLRAYLAVSQVVSVLTRALPLAKGEAEKTKLRKDLKATLSSEANACVVLPDAIRKLCASHFDA